MIVLNMKIAGKDGGPMKLKRGMGPIMKRTLVDAGRFWHRLILRIHFSSRARTLYSHRKRTRHWMAAKKRITRMVYPIDNLLTGKTKRLVSHAPSITGTSRMVRVRMTAPSYIKKWQADEITRVSTRDRARIVARVERNLNKHAAQLVNRRQRRDCRGRVTT